MGDVGHGFLIMSGKSDLFGAETELQLYFTKNKRLAKANLILGPAGIDEENCIKKFKTVTVFLVSKYGNYRHKILEKDPVIDELIYASSCYPVSLGLYYLEHVWFTKQFIIKASLLGDDEGLYIEIEYHHRSLGIKKKKQDRKKILRRL